MPAIAMSDHRCLTGVVEFTLACQKDGIQPIYGLTVDVEWQYQKGEMVLLVQNREGWSNLCKLSSKLMVEEAGSKACLTLDDLFQNQLGLVALTGGQRSILDFFIQTAQHAKAQNWLKILKEIYQENLFVEIQQHTPSQEVHARRVVEASRQSDIPMVATQSVYYLNQVQAGLQKTLSAMRENHRLKDLQAEDTAPPAAYFASAKEMIVRFQ
jgi:DNA polymerase-3 subunit alpha